jgi:hypothetical protein
MDDPEIDAEFDISSTGARAAGWLVDWFRKHRRQTRLAGDAKRTLGVEDGLKPAYCHLSEHSQATRLAPHPDNQDALGVLARSDRAITTVDELRTSVGKNLVLIGSPTAERLSRIAFGYRPSDSDNGLALTDAPVELPLTWWLNPQEFGDATAVRNVRGRGWSSRPNWSITDRESGEVFIPQTDSSGVLTTDYLLVTRMPNFLTTKALGEAHYLLSVGGAHGTGTRAIELLLDDRAVLARLAEGVKRVGQKAFQALFEVGHFDHAHGTRARAISLIRVAGISGDDGTWRHAAEVVADSVMDLQRSTDPAR